MIHIDKQAVAHSFSKAASHYDQFAQLQRDIGEQLYQQISSDHQIAIVDLGCGTGYFSEKLSQDFPDASIRCFDLSDAMLAQVKKRQLANVTYQQGDIDTLPFAENSLDLIYSNLVVQWSVDLSDCLAQIKSSLQTGGKLYLSTLLMGTLNELTQAWKTVDSYPHTNSFLSLESIEKQLQTVGFVSTRIKTETRVLQYDNVIEVMRALKGIGANHVHQHHAPTLSGRKLLAQLEQGYLPYKNSNNTLNLTYQVCYIEATK